MQREKRKIYFKTINISAEIEIKDKYVQNTQVDCET